MRKSRRAMRVETRRECAFCGAPLEPGTLALITSKGDYVGVYCHKKASIDRPTRKAQRP